MPSEGSLLALEALSWPAPDLHKVWSLIVEQNAPITVAQTNPDTKTTYEILNPELGLNSEFSTPVVILSGYEAMYERLLSTHEEGRTMNLRMRLLFVGQPGTGKTLFLLYALARACKERRRLAVHWRNEVLYYFPMTSAPKRILLKPMMSASDLHAELEDDTIILCDSNSSSEVPPPILAPFGGLLAVTAPPQWNRWGWAVKDHVSRFHHTQLPSFQEIKDIITSMPSHIKKPNPGLLDLVGPSPGLLHSFASYGLEDVANVYKDDADRLASDLVPPNNSLKSQGDVEDKQSELFHRFFFVIGSSLLPDSQAAAFEYRPRHAVGTLWQLRLLRDRILRTREQDASSLLAALSNNRTCLSIAFECVLLQQVERGERSEQYTLSGLRNKPSPLPQKKYFASPFEPAELVLTEQGSLPPANLNASKSYFVKTSPRFPAVDAFMLLPNRVILLQLAVASRHDLRRTFQGLRRVRDFVENNFPKEYRDWELVFITSNKDHGTELVEALGALDLSAYAFKKLHIELRLGSLHIPLPSNVPWSRDVMNIADEQE